MILVGDDNAELLKNGDLHCTILAVIVSKVSEDEVSSDQNFNKEIYLFLSDDVPVISLTEQVSHEKLREPKGKNGFQAVPISLHCKTVPVDCKDLSVTTAVIVHSHGGEEGSVRNKGVTSIKVSVNVDSDDVYNSEDKTDFAISYEKTSKVTEEMLNTLIKTHGKHEFSYLKETITQVT